jgi:hypothetical protein
MNREAYVCEEVPNHLISRLLTSIFSRHFRYRHDLGISLSPSSSANPCPLFTLA